MTLTPPQHQAALRALLDRRLTDRRTAQQIAATGPRRVKLTGDFYHVVVPPGAVRIDRGTLLGNPFPESTYGIDLCLHWYQRFLDGDPAAVEEARRAQPNGRPLWKSWRTHGPALVRLAAQRIGTSPVACWCKPDQQCHGDLLLAATDRLAL